MRLFKYVLGAAVAATGIYAAVRLAKRYEVGARVTALADRALTKFYHLDGLDAVEGDADDEDDEGEFLQALQEQRQAANPEETRS